MEQMLSLVDQNISFILMWMSGIIFLFFIFIIIILARLSKLNKKYKTLTDNKGTISIEQLLLEHNNAFNSSMEKVRELDKMCDNMDKRIVNCLQKVGIVRYNAFYDTGSDQSFSLAMLDDKNNGIILSGIFGRNESTTYAKPVFDSKSKYTLSKEEQQALEIAIGGHKGV